MSKSVFFVALSLCGSVCVCVCRLRQSEYTVHYPWLRYSLYSLLQNRPLLQPSPVVFPVSPGKICLWWSVSGFLSALWSAPLSHLDTTVGEKTTRSVLVSSWQTEEKRETIVIVYFTCFGQNIRFPCQWSPLNWEREETDERSTEGILHHHHHHHHEETKKSKWQNLPVPQKVERANLSCGYPIATHYGQKDQQHELLLRYCCYDSVVLYTDQRTERQADNTSLCSLPFRLPSI